MSTAGANFEKRTSEHWSHPDAPERYEKGRRCQAPLDRCKTAEDLAAAGDKAELGKLRSTAKAMDDVLLCEPCMRWCLQNGIPHRIHAGLTPNKGRVTSYPLPNLSRLREKAGVSVYELAEAAECSRHHIERIEEEGRLCGAKLATRMARILGVDVRHLSGRWGR